jgi:DNA repair exonuclease SbcCD ATPase subunit
MKALTITEVKLPNGFRSILPTNIDILKHFGANVISGNAGAGKTSLLEVMKWATQGKSALRDGSYFREGEDSCEVLVKIADAKEPEGLSFWISAVSKKDGSVDYKFKAEVDGKLKNTKDPIEGLTGITPNRMWEMLSTTLTYDSAKFMSENEKTVTDFIIATYPEVADIAKDIEKKIDEKVKERDVVSQRQVKIGAYKTQLEGLVQPNFIDISTFQAKREAIITEIATAKGKVDSFEQNKALRISSLQSQANSAMTTGKAEKDNIQRFLDVHRVEYEKEVAQVIHSYDEAKYAHSNLEIALRVLKFSELYPKVYSEVLSCSQSILDAITVEGEKLKDSYVPLLDINALPKDSAVIDALPKELSDMVSLVNEKRVEIAKVNKEIETVQAETIEDSSKEIQAAEDKLNFLDKELEEAKSSNDLWEKFDVQQQYETLHNEVMDLRAERIKLYEGINTGVKGLIISLTDEDGKRLGFKYTGAYDPTYFSNPNADLRPLTSYSKSQKVLISALLQCTLMKKRAYPLNVLCVDDTGLDNKVYELYDKFAKKNGLLIFVTSTNDKTEGDLRAGEILITEGHVLVKEFAE